MKKLVQIATALSLAALIASPIFAGDQKKTEEKGDKAKAKARAEKGKEARAEKGKEGRAKQAKARSVVRLPKGIELSAEQQEKLAAINAKYAGKVGDLREKMAGLVTAEQRKAKAEAIKAAREAGKKGPEARAAIAEAGNLSEEQQAKAAELKKALGEITKQAQTEAKGILTDEQVASLRGGKQGKPDAPRKNKDDAKKKRDVAKAEKKKAETEKN